ncbi:MAG: DUF2279 domain-containing protein [Saprospiraceae bacterium]|nr:YfiM family protein [Saprospiraceae bacterium]MDW8230784.1 DUF2279 domain-containing protein [Saprospiraceae bacterium]
MLPISRFCLISALGFVSFVLTAQTRPPMLSLMPADSFHAPRFWGAVGVSAATYGAAMVVWHNDWQGDNPSGKFQFVNDLPHWNQMDKMSHALMSYQQSRWVYGGARWAGVKPSASAWLGFAGSQLIMTTLEVFDGFSPQGGFSWSDVSANLIGSGLFLGQQLGWGKQRISLKWSAQRQRYPTDRLYPFSPPGSENWGTLEKRAQAIYGTGLLSFLLKDYNGLTVWASANPRAFLPEDRATWLPRWLNIAVGMGAQNLYTAQGYEWKGNLNCSGPYCDHYRADPQQYPRTRQFYLSLDVDLTRLPIRNRFLRTLAYAVNIVKIPAPALEWTNRGGVRFHPIYF